MRQDSRIERQVGGKYRGKKPSQKKLPLSPKSNGLEDDVLEWMKMLNSV